MAKTKTANNGLDFYRIKTEWVKEKESGDLEKVKTEELVLASCYAEAEQVVHEISVDQSRTQYGDMNIEIIKTKICDVYFNDILSQDKHTTLGLVGNYFEESEESGVGLYMVKVIFFYLDEKTGKTKRTTETYFIPATSNSDATSRIEAELNKNSLSSFVIRDTKFDKAEAIYWPVDVHEAKTKSFDLKQ